VACALALYEAMSPSAALAQSVRPNQIVPDGRTATTLSSAGTVTDVRSGTVSGANAYNSFSTFNVGQGQTVNLHVPAASSNLINIVRDQRTTVDGVLNAIKAGRIGGNVHFATPNGMLVSANGVAQGTRVVERNGRIEIVADNDITVSGAVAAPGSVGVKAGDITIRAGRNIDLQPAVRVMAHGDGANSSGGSVYIYADNNTMTRNGALIDASADRSGNGGRTIRDRRRRQRTRLPLGLLRRRPGLYRESGTALPAVEAARRGELFRHRRHRHVVRRLRPDLGTPPARLHPQEP
jgi:filamentous hemagglutinin family protein